MLGALEVVDEDGVVPLGGRRQRSLLAVLLLRANKVVSSDSLIDDLWADHPPATAQHTLHAYVSRLRKVLHERAGGEQVLLSYPDGYLLRVQFGQLDLDRFERLAEEGRRALHTDAVREAAAICREALVLWRGPALADLRYESFARVDVERLEEQRLGVLEDRIQADLQLGQHAALVAELERLVAEHPLREGLREELMLALYRSGRRAEALAAYRSARRYLVEECGLEPGKSLQLLHRAMLDQDQNLDLQPAERAVVPAAAAGDQRRAREPANSAHPGGAGGAAPPPNQTPPGTPATGAGFGRTNRRRWLLAGAAGVAAAVTLGVVAVSDSRSEPTLPGSAVHANAVLAVDPGNAKLLRQADTGGRPGGITYGFGRLWVTDSANGRVLVMDPATLRLEDQIPVGRTPTNIAATANGIWVIDPGSGTVSEIAATSDTIVASISVGTSPSAIAAGSGGLWVTDASSGMLTRIDPESAKIGDTIFVGQPLTDVTVGLGAVWVTSASSGQLIEVDPRRDQVTRAVGIGNGAASVRVLDGSVWVANPPDDTVSRFEPDSGRISKVDIPDPTAVAVSAGRLWVTDGTQCALSRVDPKTGRSSQLIVLGNPPTAIVGAGADVAVITGSAPNTHRGGTLRVVAGAGVDSIDPGAAYSLNDWQLLSMTNDGLLAYSRADPAGTATLVPDLAISLPVVDEAGRRFTFTLRRGLRYSDGTPISPARLSTRTGARIPGRNRTLAARRSAGGCPEVRPGPRSLPPGQRRDR